MASRSKERWAVVIEFAPIVSTVAQTAVVDGSVHYAAEAALDIIDRDELDATKVTLSRLDSDKGNKPQ